MDEKIKGVIAGLLASIVFGVAVVWTKQSFETYGPIASSTGRILVAVIGLFIYGILSKEIQVLKKKDIGVFLFGGLLVPFLFYVLVYDGILYIDAIVAGIVFATMPLFSPLASYLFFGTRFNKLFFVGMIISFIGVVIAITSSQFEFSASPLGIGLMTLGIMVYVYYTILIKKLSVSYSNTSIIFYSSVVGLVMLFILFFLTEYNEFIHTEHSLKSTMAIIYMGFGSSFVGFILYAYSIKVLGPARAMMFFNLVPIFAALGAVVILHDHFTTRKMLGLIIVVIGLYLTMIRKK